jgi:hypothetical protein
MPGGLEPTVIAQLPPTSFLSLAHRVGPCSPPHFPSLPPQEAAERLLGDSSFLRLLLLLQNSRSNSRLASPLHLVQADRSERRQGA